MKKTISQITNIKMLESFLMNVKVIFYIKKQMKLEKKLNKKEANYYSLKEKGKKSSLTNKEKKKLGNIDKYLKNFKNDLDKSQKYQYNITYGLDYLFSEFNEVDYYEPKEVKSAFNDSYVLYKNKGDKDNKLAIYENFDIIKPYLKDIIDKPKANGE